MRNEFLFAGFGGQGIIKAALLLTEAAGLHDGKEVVQTQSYGPEARGGACRSEVVISDTPIDYIRTMDVDVLVAMSQYAFDVYKANARKKTKILIDAGLVTTIPPDMHVYAVPATQIAQDEFGRALFANIIMLGALAAVTEMISLEGLSKTLDGNVPAKTLDTNRKALQRGYELGMSLRSAQ